MIKYKQKVGNKRQKAEVFRNFIAPSLIVKVF
jgi:hypothetical protein